MPNNALHSAPVSAGVRWHDGSTAGPHKGMAACDHRLTFAALNLADAKRPIAHQEQPSYRQTQLRNEYGPSPRELRR
jgi:hypothetical protein